ncbi:MAG TPA: winged helix-turn-helix transcriptional regulator [Sphingomicrobium sp.]|nr:winged helix-turn-helix transcriptional regulator [Sphingomicrobium sp.]
MQSEKITKERQGEGKRGYDDACGLAHALELIGERWALLVMRELMFGPRRFSGLKRDLPGISANVLTQRLAELEERGLVRKAKLPPPASVQVYEATEWGLEAAPVLRELGRWAVRSLAHDPARPVSHVSIMMSMQTMFDSDLARGFSARAGFQLGAMPYVAEVRDGRIHVERGDTDDCDFVVTAAPEGLAGVLYGGAPIDAIEIEGDLALARRFMTLFPLPAKVS